MKTKTLLITFFVLLCISLVIFSVLWLVESVIDTAYQGSASRIPNLVHFVLFEAKEDGSDGDPDLDFVSAICILAAFLHHGPDLVIVHTNIDALSPSEKLSELPYWSVVAAVLGDRLQIRLTTRPTHVFGLRLSSVQHSADVKRLQILLSEGGIILDLDTYIVSSLNEYLDSECVIGWPENQSIGNQIVLARPQARFIQLWLQSYKDYRPSMWYYNAGELPTQHILKPNPELVQRVPTRFGVHNLAHQLYAQNWSDWQNFSAIHLLSRHRSYLLDHSQLSKEPVLFDEHNIQLYNFTFGQMARRVWNDDRVQRHLQLRSA